MGGVHLGPRRLRSEPRIEILPRLIQRFEHSAASDLLLRAVRVDLHLLRHDIRDERVLAEIEVELDVDSKWCRRCDAHSTYSL